MAALWAMQLRTKNAGVVDAGWTALVAGLAIFYATQAHGMPGRRLAIASMMGSWGARLTDLSAVRPHPGKARGRPICRTATRRVPHAKRWFFWFFQAQAAAAVFFSTPALFASVNSAPEFTLLEFAGAALWIVGFAGETTADRQLLHFKMDPENSGPHVSGGALAILAPSELFLRVDDLDRERALRGGIALGLGVFRVPGG